MASLAEILLTKETRPRLTSDAARVVDEEVQDKSGLSGIAIKAAYAVVKAVKPGIVPEVIDSLLEDFVGRMEEFYAEWQAASPQGGFAAFLEARSGRVADGLLGSTDERARVAKNATLKKTYERLRPSGKKHVETAIPRLGRMIQRYLPVAQQATPKV